MRLTRNSSNAYSRLAAIAAVLLAGAATVTGCSAAAPGDTEAKNYLQNRFGNCPLWTLSNPRKVDVIQRGETYVLMYEASLTFRPDFARTTLAGVEAFVVDPANKVCRGELGMVVSNMAGTVDLNTHRTILRGAVPLARSEQGWRLLRDPDEKFVKPTN
ncbi:hypothetical protein [Bordetella sp. LUAb4]|uniref:hypothetical protein n=1 Tax=Bordetella sp. LUAb4 TaxID=2843195 RepID=UPI001E359A6E|nr:hypothetical protein [Bordetella sp. LUAb4]